MEICKNASFPVPSICCSFYQMLVKDFYIQASARRWMLF
jgi:hypothetical protein